MSKPAYRDFRATVSHVQRVSPSFVRVTLAGEGLADFGDTCLDQRIKVVFPRADRAPGEDAFATFPTGETWYMEWREQPEDQRHTFRTYTPSAVRRAQGEMDIDVAVHGDSGPGSLWALTVQPGDPVMVFGPDATVPGHERAGVDWTPGSAQRFLLAGDETAVPAIVNILRVLPAGATGQAFLEVPTDQDVRPLEAPAGLEVVWLPRAGGQAAGELLSQVLPARLTVEAGEGPAGWALSADAGADAGADTGAEPAPAASDADAALEADPTDDPEAVPWEVHEVTDAGRSYAWLAAESTTVKTLRRHLVNERGWDKGQVAFMGYWKRGVSQA